MPPLRLPVPCTPRPRSHPRIPTVRLPTLRPRPEPRGQGRQQPAGVRVTRSGREAGPAAAPPRPPRSGSPAPEPPHPVPGVSGPVCGAGAGRSLPQQPLQPIHSHAAARAPRDRPDQNSCERPRLARRSLDARTARPPLPASRGGGGNGPGRGRRRGSAGRKQGRKQGRREGGGGSGTAAERAALEGAGLTPRGRRRGGCSDSGALHHAALPQNRMRQQYIHVPTEGQKDERAVCAAAACDTASPAPGHGARRAQGPRRRRH